MRFLFIFVFFFLMSCDKPRDADTAQKGGAERTKGVAKGEEEAIEKKLEVAKSELKDLQSTSDGEKIKKEIEVQALEEHLKNLRPNGRPVNEGSEGEDSEWIYVSSFLCFKGDQTAVGDKMVYVILQKNSSSNRCNLRITSYAVFEGGKGSQRAGSSSWESADVNECAKEPNKTKKEYEEEEDINGRTYDCS